MKPTPELRFVERDVHEQISEHADIVRVKTLRILQQKWENTYWTVDESGGKFIEHEWRDVPVEKETDRG